MPEKLTTEIFKIKAKLKHPNNEYDYSLVVYINTNTAVEIICNAGHGSFMQTPNNHLNGKGCTECGRIKIVYRRALFTFIGVSNYLARVNSVKFHISL